LLSAGLALSVSGRFHNSFISLDDPERVMSLHDRVLALVGFPPMAHRPKLEPRFWLYCVAAYLMPVVSQVALPRDPGMYDELVWLVTLAPAFILSLHYGLKGAVAGLLMGTALFIAVQIVVALNYTPDDWRITVPVYIAYGTLAISVGWLSEQLHEHYTKALANERLATVGQFAITVRHQINNALTAIVAESQLLSEGASQLSDDQRRSLEIIRDAAFKIGNDLRKLSNLAEAPVTEYPGGVKMLDLTGAPERTSSRPPGGSPRK
jgi:signal transduction histidine kinase